MWWNESSLLWWRLSDAWDLWQLAKASQLTLAHMRELVVVAAFDFHQLNHVFCKVGKTLLIFSLGISLKDSTTTFNNSWMLRGAFWCWRDWIALKNLKSRTLRSGLLGSWHTKQIQNPSLSPSRLRSGSSAFGCGFALFCCTNAIGKPRPKFQGNKKRIAGKTWQIKKSFVTSLVINVKGLVSIVSTGWLLLLSWLLLQRLLKKCRPCLTNLHCTSNQIEGALLRPKNDLLIETFFFPFVAALLHLQLCKTS